MELFHNSQVCFSNSFERIHFDGNIFDVNISFLSIVIS